MKVTDPQQPVNDQDVNADHKEAPEKSGTDEPSAFSRVLAKKREATQEGGTETKTGKRSDQEIEEAAAALMQQQTPIDQPIQVTQIESKHVVALPPEMHSLVREISVVVNAAGTQQVHIEMNSNVMKGLHIQIERKDGAVAIQFQSSSDDVATLLQRNTDALSQSLADRGINVADIRVTRQGETARVTGYKNAPAPAYPQGRRQGGRQ
jgi:flagellar hook-length control protein FliK